MSSVTRWYSDVMPCVIQTWWWIYFDCTKCTSAVCRIELVICVRRVEATEQLWQEVSTAAVLRTLCPAPFDSLKTIRAPVDVLEDGMFVDTLASTFFNGNNRVG